MSECLKVGVCLLREAAVETNGVKTLDSYRQSLEKERCLPLVTGLSCEATTQLGKESDALGVDGAERLECQWNEAVRACQHLVFDLLIIIIIIKQTMQWQPVG